MKTQRLIVAPLALMLLALTSCGTTKTMATGSDPVVAAQETMALAKNAFDLIEKSEYDAYPAFKAANAEAAGQVRTFVNSLRVHDAEWLQTAYNMTEAYRINRTTDNRANLQTALAVLSKAIEEANKYLAMINAHKS